MRILAITPIAVDDDELRRRQARYDRLAPPGLSVHLENLGAGPEVPRALETADDVAASEAALQARFAAADPEGFDAFLSDCVLDPVVDQGSSYARPVHGIARLTAHHLAGLGLRTGAVARNRAIADELDRRLRVYGVTAEPTVVMDLSLEDIVDDATWAAGVEKAVAGADCQAVINACSAVDVTPVAGGPRVVDPTATALRLLAFDGQVGR